MVPWNAARTKVQIRLSIQRLRTLQEKKLALAKKSRREIADLLLNGRIETARLRVEGLIQDDIYVELLELLELYSEKLQARFNLLDAAVGPEPEPSISDAVCAIVYAAPRTELKELQVLREILMHRYGRNFSLALQSTTPPPELVPPRVSSKLALYTPARELVDAYMYEIAKGYGLNWVPEAPARPEVVDGPTDDDGVEGIKGEGETSGSQIKKDGEGEGEGDDQGKGKGKEDKEDQVVKKDSPPKKTSTDLPTAPTYPAGNEKDVWAEGKKGTTSEEEDLASRFARLKNLR